MIYIDEDTTTFYIPKHLKKFHTGPFTLLLVNNYSNNNYSYSLSGKVSLSDFYYTVIYTITDIPVGEYTYKLLDTYNEIVESGLLTFGDYTPAEKTIYNTDKTNKIIYGE